MRREFLVERQGRTFCLYAGLLNLAHEQGLRSIQTNLVQVPSEANKGVAIVTATVTMERDGVVRVFTGIGDAAVNNVAPAMQTCLIRMAECVPLSSRALTRDGWKSYEALTIGEDILAYDIASNRCKWTPLQKISVFHDDFPTLHLKSRSFDAFCTPDHSWVSSQYNNVRLLQAKDMSRHDLVVIAAMSEGGDSSMTPREAALIGWLATDGCVRKHPSGRRVMRISQSKPQYLPELRSLVGADGYEYSADRRAREFTPGKFSECQRAHAFDLKPDFVKNLVLKSGLDSFDCLPGIVTRLSVEARASMLDAMLKGDGQHHGTEGQISFGQKAKPGVMEAFEILATLQGIALGSPVRRLGIPVRTLRKTRNSLVKMTPGPDQPVWCPTTEYGTWVMNQNGFITITGNTRAKARALRDSVNIGVAAFEELGEEDAHDGAPERGYPIAPGRSARIERPGAPRTRALNPTNGRSETGRQSESTPIPAELRNPAANPRTEDQANAVRNLCRRLNLEPDSLVKERLDLAGLADLTQAQAGDLIKALSAKANGRPSAA